MGYGDNAGCFVIAAVSIYHVSVVGTVVLAVADLLSVSIDEDGSPTAMHVERCCQRTCRCSLPWTLATPSRFLQLIFGLGPSGAAFLSFWFRGQEDDAAKAVFVTIKAAGVTLMVLCMFFAVEACIASKRSVLRMCSSRENRDMPHLMSLVARSATLISGLLATTASLQFYNAGSFQGDCPAFFSQVSAAPPGDRWPEGVPSASVVKTPRAGLLVTWCCSVALVLSLLLVVIVAQRDIGSQSNSAATAAADRMRVALRYISHESRSPLGGAVLSLALMDQCLEEGLVQTEFNVLVGDLHASLEAAKRPLDDLLMFERMTSVTDAASVAWAWKRVIGSELAQQVKSFAGTCRASAISLTIRSPGFDEIVLAGGTEGSSRVEAGSIGGDVPSSMHSHDMPEHSLSNQKRIISPRAHLDERIEVAPPKLAVKPVGWCCARQARVGASPDMIDGGGLATAIPPGIDSELNVAEWEVYVDIDRVMAVVHNALSNSVKHAPFDGTGRIQIFLTMQPISILHGKLPLRERPVKKRRFCGSPSRPRVVDMRSRRNVESAHDTTRRANSRSISVSHPAQANHGSFSKLPIEIVGAHKRSSSQPPPRAKVSPVAADHTEGGYGTSSHTTSGSAIVTDRKEGASSTSDKATKVYLAPETPVAEELLPSSPSASKEVLSEVINEGAIEPRVLVIEVRDNGCGIAEDVLTGGQLFRPFQQLRMGNAMFQTSSSGLGLATVNSIVAKQFGGEITIASRQGAGTLFIARLPVWARRVRRASHVYNILREIRLATRAGLTDVSRADEELKHSPSAGSSLDLFKPLVYVVDDEYVLRHAVSRALKIAGFQALMFESGQEFLDQVERLTIQTPDREEWPSVVLMDAQMPGLDGVATLKKFRVMQKDVRHPRIRSLLDSIVAVAMTGSSSKDVREAMINAGASDVLIKPVKPELLVSTVMRYSRV
jgi:signal transduction histidine kinase/CheY-like chemotaxis protein